MGAGRRGLAGSVAGNSSGVGFGFGLSVKRRAWSLPVLMEGGGGMDENGGAGYRRFSEGGTMRDSRVGDAVGKEKGEDRRIVDDFAEIRDHYGELTLLWFISFGLSILFSSRFQMLVLRIKSPS